MSPPAVRMPLVASLVALLLAACGSGAATSPPPTPTALASAPVPSASGSQAATWSYAGATGPAHWAELDPTWRACSDGKTQSPIDLFSPDERRVPDPVFDYHPGNAKIVNDGHTILAIPAQGSTITVVDHPVSTLLQLQAHAPAEHVIAHAAPAAAEMQFVHQDPSGAITIVGVAVVEGLGDDAAWAPYIDAMTTPVGTDGSASIDWPRLIPSELEAWYYAGSLTTPPCTEGVQWIFLTTPIRFSAAQIQKIKAAYVGNARPVQPLGDSRELTIDLKGD